MTFVSLSFVAFLFVGIALFYICPVKYRWLVLLGLSVWFYAQSNIAYLPCILLSTLSIYLAGVVMGKFWAEQENKLSAEGLSKDEKKSRLITHMMAKVKPDESTAMREHS